MPQKKKNTHSKAKERKVNIWKYFVWNPRHFLRTHDFLFGTHDFFLGTHDFFLGTHDFLPTTHDFLPTTHDFLPTTHDFLPTTHDFLPTTHDILPTTHDPRLLASPPAAPGYSKSSKCIQILLWTILKLSILGVCRKWSY
jgi:hypothetical protein